jgi:hypothetical protein
MNNCGECTVCCTLSVVEELGKGVGETCGHCILKKGCGIYNKRPKVCKEYECAYLQAGGNIELRPDKCGVMFSKKSDRIFSGMLVPDVPITDLAMKQIVSFNKQGYSVVMLKLGEERHIELAEGHDRETINKEYINLLVDGNV